MTPPLSRAPRLRLGLRPQLILAFGFLCLLLTAMLAIAAGGVSYLLTVSEQTVRVEGLQSRIASEIAVATLMCRRYEKDLLLNMGDPALEAEYMAKWESAHRDLNQAIARYAEAAPDAEAEAQARKWKAASLAYGTVVRSTGQAIVDGQITTSDAANAALNIAKDPIRTLTDSAIVNTHAANDASEAANREMAAVAGRTLTTVLTVGGLALLLAVGWSLLFPARLLQPVARLREATHRLAAGDLSASANIQRGDELGDLGASFDQMAAQIRAQIAELDQRAIVERQNEELRSLLELVQALEMPTIPLADGVLLVPLVGQMDARRMRLVQQRTLEAVAQQRIRHVVLDLTGVAAIDAQVASHLHQVVTAVRLLGAQAILTGISAQVAHTLSRLGISFDGIATTSRVQEGIAFARSGL